MNRGRSLLAAAQGRYDDAIAHLVAAGECCERIRATIILTWVRLDHAELLLARGHVSDGQAARALARAALTTAENEGMKAAATRALTILSIQGDASRPGPVPPEASAGVQPDSSVEGALATG